MGDTIETCLGDVEEVLHVLKLRTKVNLVLTLLSNTRSVDRDCLERLEVGEVVSLSHNVVKQKFEDNLDDFDSRIGQDKIDVDNCVLTIEVEVNVGNSNILDDDNDKGSSKDSSVQDIPETEETVLNKDCFSHIYVESEKIQEEKGKDFESPEKVTKVRKRNGAIESHEENLPVQKFEVEVKANSNGNGKKTVIGGDCANNRLPVKYPAKKIVSTVQDSRPLNPLELTVKKSQLIEVQPIKTSFSPGELVFAKVKENVESPNKVTKARKRKGAIESHEENLPVQNFEVEVKATSNGKGKKTVIEGEGDFVNNRLPVKSPGKKIVQNSHLLNPPELTVKKSWLMEVKPIKNSFSPGELVFAKVKGFPAWPARITGGQIRIDKYSVVFFGTLETAVLKSSEMWPYTQENREKFVPPNLKRKGYSEALYQIENTPAIAIKIQKKKSIHGTQKKSNAGKQFCEECKKYVVDYNFSRHMKDVHASKQQAVTCPHCRNVFKNKSSLQYHVKRYHGLP